MKSSYHTRRKLNYQRTLCLTIFIPVVVCMADSIVVPTLNTSSSNSLDTSFTVSGHNSTSLTPWSMIQEAAASIFPSKTDLRKQGYPVFTQQMKKHHSRNDTTIYTSDQNPKLIFTTTSNDLGKDLVIVPDAIVDDLDEDVITNSTLVFIRCKGSKDKYTAHLAYMRISLFVDGVVVEWDTLNVPKSNATTELDILAAFTPSDYELDLSFRPVPKIGNNTVLIDNKDKGRFFLKKKKTIIIKSPFVDGVGNFNPDCTKQNDGRFHHLPGTQCLRYFKCVTQFKIVGKLIPQYLMCPGGQHFHEGKGHCVSVNEIIDMSTCDVPKVPATTKPKTTTATTKPKTTKATTKSTTTLIPTETTTEPTITPETEPKTPVPTTIKPTTPSMSTFKPDCKKKYKDGLFHYVPDTKCLQYFKCVKKLGKWVPTFLTCPDGSHFHESKGLCVSVEEIIDLNTCDVPRNGPTTSRTTTETVEPTTEPTNSKTTTPTSAFKPDCKKYSDGQSHPVPNSNCSQYFKCEKKLGKFVVVIQTCVGETHFVAGEDACVPNEQQLNFDTCVPNTASETTPTDSESTLSTETVETTTEPTNSKTTTPTSAFKPDCKKYSDGQSRPVPNTECSQYFKCEKKSGKFVVVIQTCVGDTHFVAGEDACVPNEQQLNFDTCEPTDSETTDDTVTEDNPYASYEHYVEPRAVHSEDFVMNPENDPSSILAKNSTMQTTVENPLSAVVTVAPKTSSTTNVGDHFLSTSDQFPYIGILNCPWEGKDFTLFQGSTTNMAVSFFIHTLRAQCHPKINATTMLLFQREIVSIGTTNITRFKLNLKSKLLNLEVLNPQQKKDFLSSIFLVGYSQAFTKHLYINRNTSEFAKISPSISTLTTMVNKIVGLVQQVKEFERHTLKINLALASMIRDWVRRMHLESEWLKRHCRRRPKCVRLNKINRRSIRHLQGILEQIFRISL